MTSMQQRVFECVFSDDVESIKELFEGEEMTEETRGEVLGAKDEVGRSALMTASMMGSSNIVKELLSHGALINEQTGGGYSSLHLAACWGHLDTVQTLLELGADTQLETFRGEKPVDVAQRYSKTDCADCLILAEALQDLISYVTFVNNLTTDPKKLTKEEKKSCLAACSAQSEWIHNVTNPTLSDVLAQKKNIEETLKPILSRLSAECEYNYYSHETGD